MLTLPRADLVDANRLCPLYIRMSSCERDTALRVGCTTDGARSHVKSCCAGPAALLSAHASVLDVKCLGFAVDEISFLLQDATDAGPASPPHQISACLQGLYMPIEFGGLIPTPIKHRQLPCGSVTLVLLLKPSPYFYTPDYHDKKQSSMSQQPQTTGVKKALDAAQTFEKEHYETGPDGSAKELQVRPTVRTHECWLTHRRA